MLELEWVYGEPTNVIPPSGNCKFVVTSAMFWITFHPISKIESNIKKHIQ